MSGPQPPDAIFALKNIVTIYAVQILQELHVTFLKASHFWGLMISNSRPLFDRPSASSSSLLKTLAGRRRNFCSISC
jgi:hypothetical protein